MEQIGAIRLVATTGQKRASYLPTMAETGLPGFVAFAWHGLYGPAGMAAKDVDILYAALAKAMSDPGLRLRCCPWVRNSTSLRLRNSRRSRKAKLSDSPIW